MENINCCINTLRTILDNEGVRGTIGRSKGLRPEELYVYLERKQDVKKVPVHVWGRKVIAKHIGKLRHVCK